MINENSKTKILIVDDWETQLRRASVFIRRVFEDLKTSDSLEIKTATSLSEAFERFLEDKFHVILLDIDMGTDEQGEPICSIDSIAKIKECQPQAKILMLTSHDETQLAVRAMNEGADDFLSKGESDEERAYRKKQILFHSVRAKRELIDLRRQADKKNGAGKSVFPSKAMQDVEKKIQELAKNNFPVLFVGETGVGKTYAAKRLNQLTEELRGPKERNLFNENISAIPEGIAESILFGAEKGAYTGATARRLGLFELADEGDLFFDEIGDASPSIQVKLLKLIEEQEFMRVGGREPIKTNARLIFATNKDLDEEVKLGKFREDLLGRINGFVIKLPELYERKEDIPVLADSIFKSTIAKLKESSDQMIKFISFEEYPEDLKEYFLESNYPLNIRGLQGDIQKLVVYSSRDKKSYPVLLSWKDIIKPGFKAVDVEDILSLEELIKKASKYVTRPEYPGLNSVKEALEEYTCKEAYTAYSSNKERAKALKLPSTTAYDKIKNYISKNKEASSL